MSAKNNKTAKKKGKQSLPEDRFINRELSWLAFNQRVLDQAADTSLPLLERAKFLAITSSNLDEFTMVRVGSLKMQLEGNRTVRDPSGRTVSEQLKAVSEQCQAIVSRQYKVLRETLEPLLFESDIQHVDLSNCSDRCGEAASQRFYNEVFAVLSPQAVFPERPFPLLQGLGIHLCVRLKPNPPATTDAKDEGPEWDFAIVPLGRTVPRLIAMPSEGGPCLRAVGRVGNSLHRRFFSGT